MNTELATAKRIVPIVNDGQSLAMISPEITAKLILEADLSKFSDVQKVEYVTALCNRLGIDPMTRPFELLVLNNRLIPYPTKAATNQLTRVHGLSLIIQSASSQNDMYVVIAEARTRDNQVVQDMGTVSIAGLRGDALQNAMMKAVTKAKRRAVLSIVGLGMIDETELPYNAVPIPMPTVDMGEFEIDNTVHDWTAAISECTTVDELESLSDQFKKLDTEHKNTLRTPYMSRLQELRSMQ